MQKNKKKYIAKIAMNAVERQYLTQNKHFTIQLESLLL